jgi:hypothetical protein
MADYTGQDWPDYDMTPARMPGSMSARRLADQFGLGGPDQVGAASTLAAEKMRRPYERLIEERQSSPDYQQGMEAFGHMATLPAYFNPISGTAMLGRDLGEAYQTYKGLQAAETEQPGKTGLVGDKELLERAKGMMEPRPSNYPDAIEEWRAKWRQDHPDNPLRTPKGDLMQTLQGLNDSRARQLREAQAAWDEALNRNMSSLREQNKGSVEAEATQPFRQRNPGYMKYTPFIAPGVALATPPILKGVPALFRLLSNSMWRAGLGKASRLIGEGKLSEALPLVERYKGRAADFAAAHPNEVKAPNPKGWMEMLKTYGPGALRTGAGAALTGAEVPLAEMMPLGLDAAMLPRDNPDRIAAYNTLTDPKQLWARAAFPWLEGTVAAGIGMKGAKAIPTSMAPVRESRGLAKAFDRALEAEPGTAVRPRQPKPNRQPEGNPLGRRGSLPIELQ